jgi:hypothetical protein
VHQKTWLYWKQKLVEWFKSSMLFLCNPPRLGEALKMFKHLKKCHPKIPLPRHSMALSENYGRKYENPMIINFHQCSIARRVQIPWAPPDHRATSAADGETQHRECRQKAAVMATASGKEFQVICFISA